MQQPLLFLQSCHACDCPVVVVKMIIKSKLTFFAKEGITSFVPSNLGGEAPLFTLPAWKHSPFLSSQPFLLFIYPFSLP